MPTSIIYSSPNDFWIQDGAIRFELNALSDPDKVAVSLAAGAVIMAWKQGVIDYNAALNYRTWVLSAAPTHFDRHDKVYVYVRLSKVADTAQLVFPYEKIPLDPSLYYDESDESDVPGYDLNFYYILLGALTPSSVGGETTNRYWSYEQGEEFSTGVLDTDEYRRDQRSEMLSQMFVLNETTNTIETQKDLTFITGKRLLLFRMRVLGAESHHAQITTIATAESIPDSGEFTPNDTSLITTAALARYAEYVLGNKFFRKDQDDADPYTATFGDVHVETGLERVGGTTSSGNLSVGGNASVDGNLSVGGNTTLGNANTDLTQVYGQLKSLYETVVDNLHSSGFQQGEFGSGYELVKSRNGKSYLEVDNLFVRLKAIFTELEIRKISYAGGNIIFSHAGSQIVSVVEQTNSWRCYMAKDDGTTRTTNWWAVGDLARCQTFNLEDRTVQHHVSNTYYWRRVEAVGHETPTGASEEYDYVDLSKVHYEASSNDAPSAGDTIVQMGNDTDAGRQGLIMLNVTGSDAPCLKVYKNVSGFSLTNKDFICLSPQKTHLTVNSLSIQTSYDTQPVPMERGAWSSITNHRCYYYDVVQHNGATWLCVYQPSSSSDPEYTTEEPNSSAVNWIVYASKGADGQNGQDGADGKDGADGVDGLSAPQMIVTPSLVAVSADSNGTSSGTTAANVSFEMRVAGVKAIIASFTRTAKPTDVSAPSSSSASGASISDGVGAVTCGVVSGKTKANYEGVLTYSVTATLDGKTYTGVVEIVFVANKQGANGQNGQNGTNGIDGQDGADGDDAINPVLTVPSIIMNQDLASPYSIDVSQAQTEVKVYVGEADMSSSATVGTPTSSECTAAKDSTNQRIVKITGVNTHTVDGKTVYYDHGTVTIPVTYSGTTYYLTLKFYVNLLGAWASTVEADTQTEVAKKLSYGYDGTYVHSIQDMGTFVKSSETNISSLEQIVGDPTNPDDGTLLKRTSTIEQTVSGISLKVDEVDLKSQPKANLLSDPILQKAMPYTSTGGSTNITSAIAQGVWSGYPSPWNGDGGKQLRIYVSANTRTSNGTVWAVSVNDSERMLLEGGKNYTFSVWVCVTDSTALHSSNPFVAEVDFWTAASGGSRHSSQSKVLIANKAGQVGDYVQAYLTVTVPTGYPYFSWTPWLNVAAGKKNFYVYYAGAKLESGSVATPMTSSEKSALLATGIDIENKKITVTADKFEVQNNSGEKTAWVDALGSFTVSGVMNNLINVLSSGDERLIAANTLMSDSNYVLDIASYPGNILDFTQLFCLDVLRVGNVVEIGNCGRRGIVLPHYFSSTDYCRTGTKYDSDSIRRVVLRDLQQMIGKKITIIGGSNTPSNFLVYLPVLELKSGYTMTAYDVLNNLFPVQTYKVSGTVQWVAYQVSATMGVQVEFHIGLNTTQTGTVYGNAFYWTAMPMSLNDPNWQ